MSPADVARLEAERLARHARGSAWCILFVGGVTQVTFNMYNSLHSGHIREALALFEALVPVLLVALGSHLVASHRGGGFMKTLTTVGMLGAMVMSTRAMTVVLWSSLHWTGLVFGGMVDMFSLIALNVILSPRRRPELATAGSVDQYEPPAGPLGPRRGSLGEPDYGSLGGSRSGSPDGSVRGSLPGPETEPVHGSLGGPETGPQREPDREPPRREPRARTARRDMSREAKAARAAYRDSVAQVAAGTRSKPLSDRELGATYAPSDRQGSRRWGADRIAECQGVTSAGGNVAAG